MIRLVRPMGEYRASFLVGIRAMAREDKYYQQDLKGACRDFAEYVKRQNGRAQGKYLPKGWVPESRYWLIDGKRFVGLVGIRHRLTRKLRLHGGSIGYIIVPAARKKGYGTKVLRLALARARRIGLKRVLLTVSPRNAASRKIIERNGGVFWSRAKSKQGVVLRYWITL